MAKNKKQFKKKYPQKKTSHHSMVPYKKAKPEKKYIDSVLVSTGVSTSGYIVLLNPIGQGTAVNARIGNRVDIKSIAYKLQLASGSTRADTSVRLCLVLDKEVEGGALPPVFGTATTQSIFDNTIVAGTASPLNPNTSDRYVIISDKLVHIQHNFAHDILFTVEKWKALKTWTQYNSSSSGISTINSNAIYLVAMSDIPTGLSEDPTLTGVSRIRFTDQ